MRDSDVKYITNVYPLVEKRITRADCVAWLPHMVTPRRASPRASRVRYALPPSGETSEPMRSRGLMPSSSMSRSGAFGAGQGNRKSLSIPRRSRSRWSTCEASRIAGSSSLTSTAVAFFATRLE